MFLLDVANTRLNLPFAADLKTIFLLLFGKKQLCVVALLGWKYDLKIGKI